MLRCVLYSLAVLLCSCGQKERHHKSGDDIRSTTERAFLQAAEMHKIPARLLFAVGKLESNLIPTPSFVAYGAATSTQALGPKSGQTAFGLSYLELGLAEGSASDSLAIQVDAYARWLKMKVDRDLPLAPANKNEKFAWVWALANAHRSIPNTRVLFAQELVSILNSGFIWQDPIDQKMVNFPKEEGVITLDELDRQFKRQLSLDTRRSEISSAKMFILAGAKHMRKPEQKPSGIEIIHCPFNLSTCLELQASEAQENFWFGAHYIIPQDGSIVSDVLQLTPHNDAVAMIDKEGQKAWSKDRVVVMLAGDSGRIVDGQRQYVNPDWLTKWQLLRMSEVVHDVCDYLVYDNKDDVQTDSSFTMQDCLTPGKGLYFSENSGFKEPFRWGQILDFDLSIFKTYIEVAGALASDTVLEFSRDNKLYAAGESVQFQLKFETKVKFIELEKLVRCSDSRIFWAPIASEDVRGSSSFLFEKKFWDKGPNGDGTQYLRAKVFGENEELIGWDLNRFNVQNTDSSEQAQYPRVCS